MRRIVLRSREAITGFVFAATSAVIGTAFGLSAPPALASEGRADLVPVPVVGCVSLWYFGLQQPSAPRHVPLLPAFMARDLAYYSDGWWGVLAPRGWSCFEMEGSDASTLLVTPQRHNWRIQFAYDTKVKVGGAFIELRKTYAWSSGRFEVADIVARMFPTAWSFVHDLEAELFELSGEPVDPPFVFHPYPSDALVRLSATKVEFVTPGNNVGIGTSDQFSINASPIRGFAMLFPNGDSELIILKMRLPPSMVGFARIIATTSENELEEVTPVRPE